MKAARTEFSVGTVACIVVELYQEGCRFPSRSRRALSAPTNGSKLPTMVGAVIYVRVSTKGADREPQPADPASRLRRVARDNGMTPSRRHDPLQAAFSIAITVTISSIFLPAVIRLAEIR
jgi:hypothetical protein